MFSEVGKLFDRNFIIGYFLPALALVAVVDWLLGVFGLDADLLDWSQQELIKDVTIFAALSWVVALCLLVLNRHIVRFLEGYWIWNLHAPLTRWQRRKFRKLKARLDALDEQFHEPAFQKKAERRSLMELLAARYPSQEEQILATSFGNTMRAYEDYPRVIFGLESIQGWSRLQAVISKEYRELLDAGRSTMNLWVNFCFIGTVTLIGYLVLACVTLRLPVLWLIPASIAVAILSYRLARSAAERWGELVKGAFDTFLSALCKSLGYTLPKTFEEEQNFWHQFSQSMVFRDPESRAALQPYRAKPTDEKAESKKD